MRETKLGCKILEGSDVADLPLVSQNAEILEAEVEKKANRKDIEALQQELGEYKADCVYQIAGGTATAITLTINNLKDGYPITFIAGANNDGAATTINDKPLYKPNTTQAPNLVTGKAYTVWYNSTNNHFFIKASAEGDASVSDVLAGKTFSNNDDTGLNGTMPNNGSINKTITTQNGQIIIPPGYTGGGNVEAVFENLSPDNIRDGVNIGGVVGSATMLGKGSETFTTSRTWVAPFTGYIDVFVVGAGGGGGGWSDGYSGGSSSFAGISASGGYGGEGGGMFGTAAGGNGGSGGGSGGEDCNSGSSGGSNGGNGLGPVGGSGQGTTTREFGSGTIRSRGGPGGDSDYSYSGKGSAGSVTNGGGGAQCRKGTGGGGGGGGYTTTRLKFSVTYNKSYSVTIGSGGTGGAYGESGGSGNYWAGDGGKGGDGLVVIRWGY